MQKRKPGLFRVFVTHMYHANRDEYDSAGQIQPHTFEEYVRDNLALLKRKFKQSKYPQEKS